MLPSKLIPPIPVLADYIGLENLSSFNDYNLCMILGLYNKMIANYRIDKRHY